MKYFLATSLTVEVLHTRHWKEGENGKYFYFSEDKFSEMVGSEDWSGKTFDVIQIGSQDWKGKVRVWKRDSGAHGRRDEGVAVGQWATGDKIKLSGYSHSGTTY